MITCLQSSRKQTGNVEVFILRLNTSRTDGALPLKDRMRVGLGGATILVPLLRFIVADFPIPCTPLDGWLRHRPRP